MGFNDVRSSSWSRALLVVGGALAFLTGLVGFLNSAVVNGEHFAEILNDVRQDEAVRDQLGQAIATAAVDAQPDLVAVEPAISAGAAAIVGSPILDGVFTRALRSFHTAMTQEGGTSAVLSLADLGATLTTALDRFAPQVAEALPEDLNVTLAQVGGQEGVAAQIIPAIQLVSTLAWVLPLATIAVLAVAVWLAPRRRLALVRLGWLLVVAGGFLGLIVLALGLGSLLADDQTLEGAVVGAALREFSQPLAIRFVGTVVLGGLFVIAAGALLPQIDVAGSIRRGLNALTRRPSTAGWSVLRALGIILVGALVVAFPAQSAQVVAVLGGLALFFVGVAELDAVAERQRAADERQRQVAREAGERPGRRRPRVWLIPALAGLAAIALLAAVIVPQHLPQDQPLQEVSDSTACNGSEVLCDKPFDQVVLASSHNSMSVADGTWFLAEQPKDMVSSLDDGIRGLLVDTWYGQPASNGRALTADRSLAAAEAQLRETYGQDVADSVRRTIDRVRRTDPTGPVQPYFCHTVCELGATAMRPEMQRLNDWLDAHPREVVALFIQDAVTPADTDAVLRAAGLADKAYVHPPGASWPTLRDMISSNKRLLVLMENTGGGSDYPYLHQGFELVGDTEYTFDSADDFTCTLKRGSADSPLFLVNHWLASFARLVSNAEQVNAYEVLRARIDECAQVRGRAPNLLAVNWYDRGDLFRVVDELNGVAG